MVNEYLKEEKDRIYSIWKSFYEGGLKTVGVENLFVIHLACEGDNDKLNRYINLKNSFEPLAQSSFLRFKKSKKQLEKAQEYANEKSALRLYTLSRLISNLGGYETDTWVTRKELEIAGHMSSASVASCCDVLTTERFLQKVQYSRRSPLKGSIAHNLTKRGKKLIAKIDSTEHRLDKEVWKDYNYFLLNRSKILKKKGYKQIISSKIKYKIDHKQSVIQEYVIYSKIAKEPSREIISQIGKRVLMLKK